MTKFVNDRARVRQFHASYIPLSALSAHEQQRYFAELKALTEKVGRGSPLLKGNAARAGIRARIVRERNPNPTTPGGTRRRS